MDKFADGLIGRKGLVFFVCALTVVIGSCHFNEKAPGGNAAIPFPAGFDWPANPALLQHQINSRDLPALRRHGWYLWAGLNTPGPNGLPIWRSWPTTTQAFARTTAPGEEPKRHQKSLQAHNDENNPINLKGPYYAVPSAVTQKYPYIKTTADVKDGDVFQFNGDIMIAGVVYNDDAYQWIRGTSNHIPLYQASELTRLLNAKNKNIPEFPARSFVLKHMYWPVKGNGLTLLPIWNDQKQASPTDYIGYEKWKYGVAVEVKDKLEPCKLRTGKTASMVYLHDVYEHDKTTRLGPIHMAAPVVPVTCFYYQKLDAAALAAMSVDDRIILDLAAYWNYGRLFQPGDYVISIAMHVFTKEIKQWTMQSLWWHNRPNRGRFAEDRPDLPPSKAPGPWRNYLLTSAYGIEYPGPGQAQLPVSYNPYIELGANHPIITNCRNCHTRSAWPKNTAFYITPNGPGPLAPIPNDSPFFDGQMRLDFQWAIHDRAN